MGVPPETVPDRAELDAALIQRVEEASLNAWPALHQMLLDGWLLRLSNGFTKRANCIVPLYQRDHAALASPDDDRAAMLLDRIRYCENLYSREQLQTVFRLTDHLPVASLDELLARRNYALLDETHVQLLDLDEANRTSAVPLATDLHFHVVPIAAWLRAYTRVAAMSRRDAELHAALVRSIRLDCAFAILQDPSGNTVACALGVLEQDLLGLFDLITTPAARGRGCAAHLLQHLLRWGQERGAQHSYLQVVASNSPALRLYERLGFRNLYRYWYRQR